MKAFANNWRREIVIYTITGWRSPRGILAASRGGLSCPRATRWPFLKSVRSAPGREFNDGRGHPAPLLAQQACKRDREPRNERGPA